ncbi:NAD(P)/FAD-dependent oxidoreductase, partial [Sutterella wadsworthensis]|uniref:NAD(P)/FAD-dependent oxidoreductase n=1 Tax=Sutterella wadsworthensis TaxID=40545 RepID=UPI0032C1BF49
VEYQYGELLSITKEGDLFIVVTDVETYQSLSVVIATGTEHRKLGVQGELEYSGKGVSYCAICDGAFFKDGKIVVVGGGDSALEEGEYLTNYGKTVSLIHRRDELRGTKILQDRFINKENTDLIFNSQVTNIIGDGNLVTHVELTDVDGNITKHEANGVFIYIGLDPNTTQLLDLGITDSEGYVLTDNKMQTNISGLFAVGDVRKKELRQIATAVG